MMFGTGIAYSYAVFLINLIMASIAAPIIIMAAASKYELINS